MDYKSHALLIDLIGQELSNLLDNNNNNNTLVVIMLLINLIYIGPGIELETVVLG